MKHKLFLQFFNLSIILFFNLIFVCSSVKLTTFNKSTFEQVIASPPPLEYSDSIQNDAVNFLQTNESPIPQPTANYQSVDPNYIQYIVDPLMSKQYYPVGNEYENAYMNNAQLTNPANNATNLDLESILKNSQNIANSGQKLDKILSTEENNYSNYFKQINSMEYNNVMNSNLDKNTMNKAYSEMINPDTNAMIINQLNSNQYNYNEMLKNLNNSQTYPNSPVIDIASDRNKMQNELAGLYKYFDQNGVINETLVNKVNNTSPIANNLTRNNTTTKQDFPRFKTTDKMNSQASLENLFSGMEEDEKDRLIHEIKMKNKDRKSKFRLELINCQNNCKGTCERIKMLKKEETAEVCLLKCNLACSNNILNKLL